MTKPKKPVVKPTMRTNAGAWLRDQLVALGYPVVSYVDETKDLAAQVILVDETTGTKTKGNVLLVDYDPGDAFPIAIVGQRYTTRGREGTSFRSSGFTEDDILTNRDFQIEVARIIKVMKFAPTGYAIFDYDLQTDQEELMDLETEVTRLKTRIFARRAKFTK